MATGGGVVRLTRPTNILGSPFSPMPRSLARDNTPMALGRIEQMPSTEDVMYVFESTLGHYSSFGRLGLVEQRRRHHPEWKGRLPSNCPNRIRNIDDLQRTQKSEPRRRREKPAAAVSISPGQKTA